MHTALDGYDLAAFDDPEYLSAVVRYDLPRRGQLDGRDVVHLQCDQMPMPYTLQAVKS